MMNLYGAWLKSYGQALNLSNLAARMNGHILDCSPMGKWNQVIVHFENKEDFNKWSPSLSTEELDFKIPDLKRELIESYLNLSSNAISDFALVIEAKWLGSILKFLNQVNINEIKIVDFRLLRYLEPKIIVMLTGEYKYKSNILSALENYHALNSEKFTWTLLDSPHPKIRDFYLL